MAFDQNYFKLKISALEASHLYPESRPPGRASNLAALQIIATGPGVPRYLFAAFPQGAVDSIHAKSLELLVPLA